MGDADGRRYSVARRRDPRLRRKECWLIHAFKHETDVLQFGKGVIREHHTYEWRSPLSSMVLPDFHPVLDEIIDRR